MNTTDASLLGRLQQPDPDPADWELLHGLYLPFIRDVLGRVPGLADEADDVTQDVLVVLLREVPGFRRRRDGSFRAWLRTITANRLRTWRRSRHRRPAVGLDATDDYLAQLEDPDSPLTRAWDREHDRHVFDQLLAAVRPGFKPATWDAFRMFAVEGLRAAEVAERLGVSENAVLLAKSHVLKRLREEAAGLLD